MSPFTIRSGETTGMKTVQYSESLLLPFSCPVFPFVPPF
jgi:hypothetical protein